MQSVYEKGERLLIRVNVAAAAYGLVEFFCQFSLRFHESLGHGLEVGDF